MQVQMNEFLFAMILTELEDAVESKIEDYLKSKV